MTIPLTTHVIFFIFHHLTKKILNSSRDIPLRPASLHKISKSSIPLTVSHNLPLPEQQTPHPFPSFMSFNDENFPYDDDDEFYDDYEHHIQELHRLDLQMRSVLMESTNLKNHDDYPRNQQSLDDYSEICHDSIENNNNNISNNPANTPFELPVGLYKGGYRRISQLYPDLSRGCEACGSLHNVLHEKILQHFNLIVCTNCVFTDDITPGRVYPLSLANQVMIWEGREERQLEDDEKKKDQIVHKNGVNSSNQRKHIDNDVTSLYYNPKFINTSYHDDIYTLPLSHRYNTQNKTLVKELYLLTDGDLSNLPYITAKNPWSKDKQNNVNNWNQNNVPQNGQNNPSYQQFNNKNGQNSVNAHQNIRQHKSNTQDKYNRNPLILQLSLSVMKLYLVTQCLTIALAKHGSLSKIHTLKTTKKQLALERDIIKRAQEEREKEIILLCKEQGMNKDMIYMKLLAEQQNNKTMAKERLKQRKFDLNNYNNENGENSDLPFNNYDNIGERNGKTPVNHLKNESAQENEHDLIMSWFDIPLDDSVHNDDLIRSNSLSDQNQQTKAKKRKFTEDLINIDDNQDDCDNKQSNAAKDIIQNDKNILSNKRRKMNEKSTKITENGDNNNDSDNNDEYSQYTKSINYDSNDETDTHINYPRSPKNGVNRGKKAKSTTKTKKKLVNSQNTKHPRTVLSDVDSDDDSIQVRFGIKNNKDWDVQLKITSQKPTRSILPVHVHKFEETSLGVEKCECGAVQEFMIL